MRCSRPTTVLKIKVHTHIRWMESNKGQTLCPNTDDWIPGIKAIIKLGENRKTIEDYQ
jgi:hypothetical protein